MASHLEYEMAGYLENLKGQNLESNLAYEMAGYSESVTEYQRGF